MVGAMEIYGSRNLSCRAVLRNVQAPEEKTLTGPNSFLLLPFSPRTGAQHGGWAWQARNGRSNYGRNLAGALFRSGACLLAPQQITP